MLWQGHEQIFGPGFLDDIYLLSKKVEVAHLVDLAKGFDVPGCMNFILQTTTNHESSNKTLNVSSKIELSDIEAMLYICFYILLTGNQRYNGLDEAGRREFSAYELQILFPQSQAGDIYQIPGILHESFILFTMYQLFRIWFNTTD